MIDKSQEQSGAAQRSNGLTEEERKALISSILRSLDKLGLIVREDPAKDGEQE